MSRELYDIKVQIHHRTEKAVLVSDDGDRNRAVWLPLSQIEINEESAGVLDLTLPLWLAKDKGLI